MQINDLFKIIDNTDLPKEVKKQMYNTVRVILKYYKELDMENDIYDVWLNADKLIGFLQAKKVKLDVDIDDIFSVEEISNYCETKHCEIAGYHEDIDDENDYETKEKKDMYSVPTINVNVDVPPLRTPWIVFYLVAINTFTFGMNAYTLFKTLSE